MKINPKIRKLYNSMNTVELCDQLEKLYYLRGSYRMGYKSLTQQESDALDDQIEYIRRLIKSWCMYLDI